jgi:uncharacterized protein (DUF1684 family)
MRDGGGPWCVRAGRLVSSLRSFFSRSFFFHRLTVSPSHPLVILLLTISCSSGPPPPDTRPYEQRVQDWRQSKDEAFKSTKADSISPLPPAERAAFKGLNYYPIDSRYHVAASLTLESTQPPVIVELQTSGAERDRYRKVGTLGFVVGNESFKLTAFALESGDLGRLFVPFGDLTNGDETYRGGRFLELDQTTTGLYDLDFNRAYNPFCVFNASYVCPVPPRENRLLTAIRAGEKLPENYKHTD